MRFPIVGLAVLLASSVGAQASLSDVFECEVTSAQHGFDSYLPPQVGDTIRLDLSHGPEQPGLRFRSANTALSYSYIPDTRPWTSAFAGCGRVAWVAGDGPGALTLRATGVFGDHPRVVVTKTVAAGGGASEEARLELSCRPSRE